MIRPLRAASLAVVLLAATAARADIADRLDTVAAEVSCTKWWNGAAPSFAKLRARVVVLTFLDPAVVTSKAAAPALAKAAEKWKDGPVTFVEVAVSKAEETVTAWAAQNGGRLVGWDAEGKSASSYPGPSVPRTYLIGPDGKIAWHAHPGALSEDVIRSQVARVVFFAPSKEAKKAAAAAKAAGEQRYGAATAEAAKLTADRFATDADRAIAAAIREEVPRAFAFQTKLLDALEKDLDWYLAVRRVERMEAMFNGTEFEAKVAARKAQHAANPRVAYVFKAEKALGEAVEDAVKAKNRRDLEAVIVRLKLVEKDFPETKAQERAVEWRLEMEKKLEALGPR